MEKVISIKELRTNLPAIRQKIQKGMGFVVIYRSKPIFKIEPLRPRDLQGNNLLKLFANPPREMLSKSKKSAAQIVSEERD